MKRILSIILAVTFLLAGCGSDTSAGTAASNVSAEEIFSTLSRELPALESQSGELVIKLLGLDPETIVSCNSGFAEDGGPSMVIVLEATDEENALKASERMNYYLTTLQNSAAQYAPADVDLLNNGYVYTKGNCAVLFVGENVEDAKKELAKLLH